MLADSICKITGHEWYEHDEYTGCSRCLDCFFRGIYLGKQDFARVVQK